MTLSRLHWEIYALGMRFNLIETGFSDFLFYFPHQMSHHSLVLSGTLRRQLRTTQPHIFWYYQFIEIDTLELICARKSLRCYVYFLIPQSWTRLVLEQEMHFLQYCVTWENAYYAEWPKQKTSPPFCTDKTFCNMGSYTEVVSDTDSRGYLVKTLKTTPETTDQCGFKYYVCGYLAVAALLTLAGGQKMIWDEASKGSKKGRWNPTD